MRGEDEKSTNRSRWLRRAKTPAEFALWTRIRSRQLGGFKFVRQEPIAGYYADSVCRERRLIIEVDGGQHADRSRDTRRDAALCALGYLVLRFWNNDVLEHLDGVLQTLLSELKKSAPHPGPLPACGEREMS